MTHVDEKWIQDAILSELEIEFNRLLLTDDDESVDREYMRTLAREILHRKNVSAETSFRQGIEAQKAPTGVE